MRWCVFAMVLLFAGEGDTVPTVEPDRVQTTVSFEAKKIKRWPVEPLSLPEALARTIHQVSLGANLGSKMRRPSAKASVAA